MKINHLFKQSVERPIDGVIKADDNRNRQIELEEYVVTREVSKKLEIFTERYLNEVTANGVWISGFYGSGKSHLLKILSLILGDKEIDGIFPAEIILPKIEDELLRADLKRCTAIPSKSLLFNIDQKFDGIGGDRDAAILEVFVKVLNEMNGYYDKQGHVAKFERDLDTQGEYEKFQETYLRVTGKRWKDDRKALVTTSRGNFAKAYSEHFGVPEQEAFDLMKQVKEEYSLSIEDFADMVKNYLDKQEPGFRLNFFVDEIGQFIGNDSSRMLNLQTVAETLATKCNGQAWLFVTSQADIQGILGEFKGTAGQDITKIQGRFKTQLSLASADVHEVIQKRLLAKKESEPEALTVVYDREKENLDTLLRFEESSIAVTGWKNSAHFCDFYPFPHYQFDLFQQAIQDLSEHDIFTGRHTSVGERSMLSVFQEVIKEVCNKEVGALATFDLMYDGIAPSIRGDIQTGIKLAENRHGALPIRILKALFLLKWVNGFKATPRNIATLLIDRIDIDIAAHEKEVAEALAELERDSLLQRNGEFYEFLTNIEKDVEKEIKNVEIDESQILSKLGNVLFSDILKDPKIRYDANNQDYSHARRLDGQPVQRGSQDAELSINIITSGHPNYGNNDTIALQSLGKAELVAILPEDLQLATAVRDFLKTELYLRQNSGSSDQNRQSVLDRRSQQNSERNIEISNLAKASLSRAPLYLNNENLTSISEGEPRVRFAKAAQSLIAYAYPSLSKLQGTYDESTLRKALKNPDDLFRGGTLPLSEAEEDVLIAVRRSKNASERISVEELTKQFERRPYGWPVMATLTLIARLYRMGKIELRVGGEQLTSQQAQTHLSNGRQRLGVDISVPQHFDDTKIKALRAFHHDFFHVANSGTDPRTVGEATLEALQEEGDLLKRLLTELPHYPFLKVLSPIAEQIEELAKKDYVYLLNNLNDFDDDLLTAQEDLLAPIKTFMKGAQRQTYDEVVQFATSQKANFPELPAQEVQPIQELSNSQHPYRGRVLPNAKQAMDGLQKLITQKLQTERERALQELEQRRVQITTNPDFAALDSSQQQQVLSSTETARQEIEVAQLMTSIRDRIQRYIAQDFPAQLTLAAQLAAQVAAQRAAQKVAEESTSADADDGSSGAFSPPVMPPVAPAPVPKYMPFSKLKTHYDSAYITTPEQLDEWLKALRQAAQSELEKGNRISL